MKVLVVFASALVVAMAQRPGYVSGPVGYPGLAGRFKGDSQTTSSSVNNRLGETAGTTAKIPIDARGDEDLAKRLNSWPRGNRPFWFLNAEHIEAQRGGSSTTPQPAQPAQPAQPSQQNVQSRSGGVGDIQNPVPETQTISPVLATDSFEF